MEQPPQIPVIKKKRQRKAKTCYLSKLPDHIVKEILYKVPFTTLLKCKSVNNSWRDILSDPDFANFREPTKVILCRKEKGLHWLEFGQAMKTHYYKPAAKPVDERFRFRIANSCNGLLLVREYKPNVVVTEYGSILFHVLNPITGEYMTLPDCEKPKGFQEVSWGLYFCPKSKQFKVVRVFYLSRYGIELRTYLHAMVHTIGAGTWRSIEEVREVFDIFSPYRYDSAFVNGSLHWLGKSNLGNLTCTFNFETEQFGSFSLPPPDDARRDFQLENIGVYRETICCSYRYVYSIFLYSMDIWLMQDYGVVESWTRIHVMLIKFELLEDPCCKVINVFENGEMLLLLNGSLRLYNPLTRSYTRLNNRGIRSVEAIVHEPNFNSLKDIVKGDCLCEIKKLN